MNTRLNVLLLLGSSLILGNAAADQFFLANGGRIDGELLNPDESPRKTFIIKAAEGGTLTLASSQVGRVVPKSEAEKKYESITESLTDTVESHMEVARQCEKAGLATLRSFHLEQVLRLDPDHEDAHHALGYTRIGGKWVRTDEFMRQRGYVRQSNGWRLPQEIELIKSAASLHKEEVEWYRKLKLWKDWVIQSRERKVNGQAEILRIRDPVAAPILLQMLVRDKEDLSIRMLCIPPLAEIGGPNVLNAFVRLVLHDLEPQVREACLDRIAKSGSKAAVQQFIRALRHEENGVVNRAAVALERMNDTEATLPLIEALQTEYKFVVNQSSAAPGFSSDGGASLSGGNSQSLVRTHMKNQPVLRALTTMHVGVNFGFDQARWRAWYAEMNRPKSFTSLRRSE